MQFVKGKPPESQYATRPGARAKRREVALGRPGSVTITILLQWPWTHCSSQLHALCRGISQLFKKH
jgi:hypothetical protein